MPSGAVPFAVALGLIVVTTLISCPLLNRLDRFIDELGLGEQKGQLKRASEWYSDVSQSIGVLVPPIVGLSIGTANNSGLLIVTYAVTIGLILGLLIRTSIRKPGDYGEGVMDPFTPMLIAAAVVNAAALIVSWAVVGTVHAAQPPANTG
jgi:hypothetical protein